MPVEIFGNAMATPSSKWKALGTQGEFGTAAARSMGTNRSKDVLALVHSSEMTPVFEQLKNVFLATTFLEFISRLDSVASSSGMCAS